MLTFGLRSEHCALHGGGLMGAAGRRPVEVAEDRVLATPYEFARHGEDEVRIGFKHSYRKLFGLRQRDFGPLRSDLRWPALPKCAWVRRVAHLRTPAHGLCHDSAGNTIRCALQKTPDIRRPPMQKPITMNLSMPRLIHQAELVVGIGFPRPSQPRRGRWIGRWEHCAESAAMQR